MRIEKKLLKISIKKIFRYFLIQFVFINLFAFIYSIATGYPRFILYDAAILFQIVFPILNAVIFGLVNRNGILQITEYIELNELKTMIENIMQNDGFIKTKISIGHDKFEKGLINSKIFNSVFQQKLDIKYFEDKIVVLGNRNSFRTLEMKLKFENNK